MTGRRTLRLFEGYGIELEYMIVDRKTLDVLPVSDEILRSAAGRYVTDYTSGPMGWSNEFVSHVMELKNSDPRPSLRGLAPAFHKQVAHVDRILDEMGGRLMPSGMHPWMDPRKETRLWPHRYRRVYETYDRIFNCRRHGWANVQSMHINIAFKGDEEFGRLHAAVRLLMPVIPAFAASSPVVGGKVTGLQDTRLYYYGRNQLRVPSIMGRIIPEPVYSRTEYGDRILSAMYRDIGEHDTDGTLRHEWLNSRGAIPRYERSAVEIRVVDVQECPRADIAIAEIVIAALKLLAAQRWSSGEAQKVWAVGALAPVFRKCIRDGDRAVINNTRYLSMFGFPESKARSGELWEHLIREARKCRLLSPGSQEILQIIMNEGTLSRRILKAAGRSPSRKRLRTVYEKLCDCLAANTPFIG
jgi:carboxylate-amine ligase